MITRNGHAQWVVFTSRTSKVLKRVDGIFANLYPDLNNRPVSGGSWGLGALGPAILWGPLQW